jgi:hypothetical protein
MLRIVRRFASIDWMGETELNMWIKKCREIVESLGEERQSYEDSKEKPVVQRSDL